MASLERVKGELVELSYESEDGGWAVARVRPDGAKMFTAVGPLSGYPIGSVLALEGRTTKHKRYGERFVVQSVMVEQPSTIEGLHRYLASGAVEGLGPKLAGRVVEAFGLDALRVLEEEPERLLEVNGIGKKRLDQVMAHWEREQSDRQARVALLGLGLAAGVVNKVLKAFGERTMAVVREDPYRLAREVRGVGFRTADAVARSLGMASNDPRRVDAAIEWCLGEAEGQGHCFLPRSELVKRVASLRVERESAELALPRLVLGGRVVEGPGREPDSRPIYRGEMERRERGVAQELLERAGENSLSEGRVTEIVETVGDHLDGVQREAVARALRHGLAVITGGPGTGKTTIVKALIDASKALHQRWELAAPTGRAAKRLAESCGQEGRTLHRLLEFSPVDGRFNRGRTNPLDVDGVVVDEASMLDLEMMESLLWALPDGASLVLVGDADQLPSVGAGQVLRDLVASGAVPVTTLRSVYRQAAGSAIVRNAHRVLRGETPVSAQHEAEPGGHQDFFLLNREDPAAAVATLLHVVDKRLPALGFDPVSDVQVLTPMRKGPLGTHALNAMLQERLNPEGETLRRGERVFRVGDRVLQVRNDYDKDVFNGDVGRVISVGPNRMAVDFGKEQPVAVDGDELDRLELAYAVSVHKSQGSEYPAVLLVLHRAHHIMLRRSLLYTALTRAKRFCCVVGSPWALERAVATAGAERRFTGLERRLQQTG